MNKAVATLMKVTSSMETSQQVSVSFRVGINGAQRQEAGQGREQGAGLSWTRQTPGGLLQGPLKQTPE